MSLADGLTFFWKCDSTTADYPTSGLTTGNPSGSTDPTFASSVATFGTGSGGKGFYWTLDSGVYFTNGTGDFTIAVRAKTTTSNAGANQMICVGPAAGGRNATLQQSTGGTRWALEQTTTGAVCETANGTYANNTMTTIVARRSSSVCTIYLDGVDQTSGDGYAGSNLDSGTITRVTVGSDQGGSEDFDGTMEFAAVWNRALSNAEMASVSESQISSDLAGTEYSAGGSTGIQNYIGFQANQIGIHRNVTPGKAEFNAVGFAPSTSAGFQIDASTGYANAVGFSAQAIYDSVGINGRINFNTGTHQTHVTRQFFGLLGQLRALGFLVDQTNSQGFFPSLGNVYFQGPTGATVTVFSAPTTFTANALLRETHFVGFQAQLIRDFFPISANTHALGFTPQYVEFIREISGPTIGETNFSGFAAQAIILGQINDAIAQKGEVNLVGFQHAVDMWRTLDILQGRINMQGFAAGVAVFQGGTVNLSGVTGEINFDTLQQAVGMYRTFYPDSGLTNAEGYVPTPSTGTLVQSIVGILNQEGFVPFIVAERYRGIVGEMRLEGFAPTIGGGLWTPKRRRATSWAAIN